MSMCVHQNLQSSSVSSKNKFNLLSLCCIIFCSESFLFITFSGAFISAIYMAMEHKTSYEDGEGDKRELQKGGDICISMAESC